jgi:hypothetical protein
MKNKNKTDNKKYIKPSIRETKIYIDFFNTKYNNKYNKSYSDLEGLLEAHWFFGSWST